MFLLEMPIPIPNWLTFCMCVCCEPRMLDHTPTATPPHCLTQAREPSGLNPTPHTPSTSRVWHGRKSATAIYLHPWPVDHFILAWLNCQISTNDLHSGFLHPMNCLTLFFCLGFQAGLKLLLTWQLHLQIDHGPSGSPDTVLPSIKLHTSLGLLQVLLVSRISGLLLLLPIITINDII